MQKKSYQPTLSVPKAGLPRLSATRPDPYASRTHRRIDLLLLIATVIILFFVLHASAHGQTVQLHSAANGVSPIGGGDTIQPVPLPPVPIDPVAPPATIDPDYDLTHPGDGPVTVDEAVFLQNTANQSSGTGTFKPFLRVQNNNTEEGFNTGASNPMSDVKTGTWTTDLQYKELSVAIVNNSGTLYYQFALDINQSGSSTLLSLDKIEIYTSPTQFTTATFSGMTDAQKLAFIQDPTNTTKRYSLDKNAMDNEILLNSDVVGSGSGRPDLLFWVPVANFAGTNPNDYIYFYTEFGLKGGDFASNSGFEEWGIITVVPEPSTWIGGALMLLGAACMQRRRIRELMVTSLTV